MLGIAELYARYYETAEQEIRLALELNPNDADAQAHASFALALAGDAEGGVVAARKALPLAPFRPEWYAGMAGIAFFSARRYEETIATLSTAPRPSATHPPSSPRPMPTSGTPSEARLIGTPSTATIATSWPGAASRPISAAWSG